VALGTSTMALGMRENWQQGAKITKTTHGEVFFSDPFNGTTTS